jgi:lipopolysaccharide export LptBFGC system permease protein LptF
MRPSLTKSLVADYARLGRFDEMNAALDDFEERQAALSREIADLYERNFDLENMASDLLEHSDSQNKQLGQLQSQRNQYRLAFFGLLAIVLFALTLLAAYKIVRKNRAKNPND